MLILPIQTSFNGFCLSEQFHNKSISIAQTNSRIKHCMFEDQPAPPTNPSPIVCHFRSHSWGSWGVLEQPQGGREKPEGTRVVYWIPLPPMVMFGAGLAGRTSPTKASDYGKVVMPWSIWEAWEEGIRYENMTCFTVWLGWNNTLLTFSHPFLIAMFDLLKVVHL